MTLANPVALLLQNLWLNWVFQVAFIVVTVLSGAWLGVLIAFAAASAASFAYRRFVNKTSVGGEQWEAVSGWPAVRVDLTAVMRVSVCVCVSVLLLLPARVLCC